MSDILLLDTSVFLNVLDVPGFNQSRGEVLDVFRRRVEQGDYFLLPLATIWETGNHLAHLADGRQRRSFATRMVKEVTAAFEGRAPYRTTHFPDNHEFLAWLRDFPDTVQRSKSDQKVREGVSLGDLSIIKEWERTRALHPLSRVVIWSLDADLMAYDSGSPRA